MTTLARNTPRPFEVGDINAFGLAAATVIYEGAAVGDNGSGYARPLERGDRFLGFAIEKADNSDGAAGDVSIRVRKRGAVVLTVTGVSGLTDVGRPVFANDDDTFTLVGATTGGLNSFIGHVARHVGSTTALVAFDVDIGEREQVVSFPVDLASVTAADVVTSWTPGFPGRIKSIDWVQNVAVTTGSKAATINAEIGTTNLTGGTVALTSAACTPKGKVISNAAITAGNSFAASDTISLEAASVTAFSEGSGSLQVTLGY